MCYTTVDAAAGGLTTGWWAVVLECFSSHLLNHGCETYPVLRQIKAHFVTTPISTTSTSTRTSTTATTTASAATSSSSTMNAAATAAAATAAYHKR